MLTTAEKFIASKYEQAVDLQLDLEAMRRYLLDRGIKRTPAAVVFDLDEVYGFHGYVSSHPATLVDVRSKGFKRSALTDSEACFDWN